MASEYVNWQKWQKFFENRSERQLPDLNSSDIYSTIPDSVARSLAIFQLGESGGGTVIGQARESSLSGVDEHYSRAIELFVAEEHRHAEILAICVRNLGGTLIRKNWTAKLFVFARRLTGLRLKVLVLLAAEVVGICYYHLIATRMPASRLKSLLTQIVNDERAHLYFHGSFLRAQIGTRFRRRTFILVWRVTMFLAAIVVLIDHRRALDDLGIPIDTVWRRWRIYTRHTEHLVMDKNYRVIDVVSLADSTPRRTTAWQESAVFDG